MTPAQREQLNIFLFEQVMGRKLDALVPDYVGDWNSCQFLLDQIERDGWEWEWWSCLHDYTEHPWTVYCVRIWKVGVQIPISSAEVRTEALCLAIARTYGWKEEG